MAGSQVESHRKSSFYVDNNENAAIRKLTESGTLFTDFGNSQFYMQEQHNRRYDDTLQKEVSITGFTVTQAGGSQFYSKPPVAELAYTPPHILSRDDVKPTRKLNKTGTVKFPRLKEFVHFHYNKVNIGCIKVQIDATREVDQDSCYGVVVESNGATWVVQRNVEHMVLLDRQLHYCVFDRGYSKLADLESLPTLSAKEKKSVISKYLDQFSALTVNTINCGTVLNFFELNSSGRRLISPNTESAINIPAIAAALVTKAYHASDFDELELKEGDLISVIDKPPASESSWWRGKKELMVGFFPSECVEVIGSRKSSVTTSEVSERERLPVLRKRDKVIAFLRQFFLHRPAISQLKQSGIVKGKVFGTDLGEYLTNSALLVPKILTCCRDVIERHGLVDGIYRLSGRATQVQKLREDFDCNRHESFSDDYLLDIHIVSTLLKTYFRELPNPLLTYQLYDPLVSCVQLRQKKRQVASLKAHISSLPPPNYRTAKCLFAHLARLSVYSKRTSMTTRNLAIVWAPNLIRYDESSGSQTAFSVLQNVSLQAAVTELLISNYDSIFGEPTGRDSFSSSARKPNVKSLSKRLVSLTTARKRKGRLTRNYNSAADYMTIVPSSNSLEKARSKSGTASGMLNRSQSVSLDSVFTTSASVHLLESTAATSARRKSLHHIDPVTLSNMTSNYSSGTPSGNISQRSSDVRIHLENFSQRTDGSRVPSANLSQRTSGSRVSSENISQRTSGSRVPSVDLPLCTNTSGVPSGDLSQRSSDNRVHSGNLPQRTSDPVVHYKNFSLHASGAKVPSGEISQHTSDNIVESNVETLDSQSPTDETKPMPMPRQPRKVHEYVNFRADKPVPLKRSPPPIKKGSSSTKRPPIIAKKPILRPYTVYSTPDSHANTHSPVQRHASAPHSEAVHYAVSNLFANTDQANNNKNEAESHRQSNKPRESAYVNVTLPQDSCAERVVSSHDQPQLDVDDCDSDDYDNNIDAVRSSSLYVDYVNSPSSLLAPTVGHLRQVSNPSSTDDAIIENDSIRNSSDEETSDVEITWHL